MSSFASRLMCPVVLLCACGLSACQANETSESKNPTRLVPVRPSSLNQKDEGYRGIWYCMNRLDKKKYNARYKYSGGLGTYCAKHQPFAVYCPTVNKTFFCYGGTPADKRRHLLHMVSYYDHATGTVPRPTILLDKQTSDAHDNPVLSVDDEGYIWIFSPSHGLSRPSFIHRSKRPFDIDEFDMVSPKRLVNGREKLIDNFSYMQAFYTRQHGFQCLFTRYVDPADRTSFFMSSKNGLRWSTWKRLAGIEGGHYQIGRVGHDKVATMMNYHPERLGLDWRTNLYYLESSDAGESWQSADGTALQLPLTSVENPALVHDYRSEKLLVYLKDLQFDIEGQPVLVYITSRDHRPGPQGEPRVWHVAHWTGNRWRISDITRSDHNYDMGSIYVEDDSMWRLIAPTEPGPQPYSAGGEMVLWTSKDQGTTWRRKRQLTFDSPRNHTYARHPINAHPDFYAFWADGNPNEPSDSALYFCTIQGDVFRLPQAIKGPTARPALVFSSNRVSSRKPATVSP